RALPSAPAPPRWRRGRAWAARGGRVRPHVAGVDDAPGACLGGGVDGGPVQALRRLTGRVHRHDEHPRGVLERVLQARRVGEVAAPDPDAPLGQPWRALRRRRAVPGDPVEQSRTSRGRPSGWVAPPRPCPAPSGGSKRNWAPPFGRTTHRVTLTRAGTVLLDQARIALDALDAAARRAQRAAAAEPELVLAARGARDRVAAAVPVDGHLGVRPYRCG